MEDVQEIVNGLFEQFVEQAQAAGITFSGYDQERGVFTIPTADGAAAQITLHNLIEYYLETRDENAVSDFVRKIKNAVGPKEDPSWEEARDSIYLSPVSHEGLMENPYAKEVTAYFFTIPVIDTPDMSIRILPHLTEKWGVGEDALLQQARQNGSRLLAATPLDIDDAEGHPLGTFRTEDRNLTAACLFAPGLKEKVSQDFGWPLYFIFPDKITCYFFNGEHRDYFETRAGSFVAEKYTGSRRISPELMEFSDSGVRSIRSWTQHGDFVVTFGEE